MSSEQNDETRNQVNRWLEAILPGKEDNGTEVGTELDKKKVFDTTRHAFYTEIKRNADLRDYSIDRLKGDQSQLNQFREKLGLWHSSIIYADLLSYRPKNPDSEKHLQQRMQALLREALVWFPDSIFAQVILHCRGEDERGMKECTAVAGDQGNGAQLELLAKVFRKKTENYAKSYGTTVSLDIHLLHRNRWKYFEKGHEILAPRLASVEETVKPHDVHIHPLPIATFYPSPIGTGHGGNARSSNQEQERPFFNDVAKTTYNDFGLCKQGYNFCMLHIAQGVDVVFDDSKDNTTVCHLYVMGYAKDRPVIDSLYHEAMKNLLSKLAHFHSIQRMLTRQAELEKNKQMMDLLYKPLQGLTDALQRVQEDSQQLRSILYDPHRAIFSAASKVRQYFTEGERISIGPVQWKIAHEPDHYPDLCSATLTLSAIVRDIFGSTYVPSSAADLFMHTMGLLFSENKKEEDPFGYLRRQCQILVGLEPENSGQILSELTKGCSERKCDNCSEEKWCEKIQKSLFALKYALHSPFKPNAGKQNLLPFFLIIDDCHIKSILKCDDIDQSVSDLFAFLSHVDWMTFNLEAKLPVPTYSMVLGLISGIFAARSSNVKEASFYIAEGKNRVLFDLENDFFKEDGVEGLVDNVNNVVELGSRQQGRVFYEAGNFHKPFMDFAYYSSCCVGKDNVNCWSESDGHFSLSAEDFALRIDKKEIEISFNCGEGATA